MADTDDEPDTGEETEGEQADAGLPKQEEAQADEQDEGEGKGERWKRAATAPRFT